MHSSFGDPNNWQGTKPREQGAGTQNPNFMKAFNQGFLKVETGNWGLGLRVKLIIEFLCKPRHFP